MIELSNITLVAVTSIKIQETIDAINESKSGILFGDVKLIIGSDAPNIDYPHIRVDYSFDSIDSYSKFIVYELHKYINTEHVLIIQYDGYIRHSDKWSDDFLKYDYIGAPWALPRDSFSYRSSSGELVRVGNGGFSLRSKALLELPTKLSMTWEPFHGFYNEDGFFTCKNRDTFIENGFKYAPIEIAARFSHEHYVEEIEGITPFGFHGKHRL